MKSIRKCKKVREEVYRKVYELGVEQFRKYYDQEEKFNAKSMKFL